METRVVDSPERGRYEIWADGARAGFAQYARDGSTVSFTHTEIESRLEGHGLGSVLVRGALDATRAAGHSVLPFCPYVRGYIQRHSEYVDLVPPDQRTRFDLPPASSDPAG